MDRGDHHSVIFNPKDHTLENRKLFLGNLNHSASKEDVRAVAEPFGTITHIIVLEGKGFGFVEFSTAEEAANAKAGLDGQELLGRPLKVDFAKPRTDNNNRGRDNRDRRPYNNRRF